MKNIDDFLNIELENVSKEDASMNENRAALINRSSSFPIAFEVDRLYGRLNLFVKPLGGKMADLPGVTGTSILPDGQTGLVLNLSEIASHRKIHMRIIIWLISDFILIQRKAMKRKSQRTNEWSTIRFAINRGS